MATMITLCGIAIPLTANNYTPKLISLFVKDKANWAMFVLLAKLVSADDVGTFSLALAIATPITILAQLQLRAALITNEGKPIRFPEEMVESMRQWFADEA